MKLILLLCTYTFLAHIHLVDMSYLNVSEHDRLVRLGYQDLGRSWYEKRNAEFQKGRNERFRFGLDSESYSNNGFLLHTLDSRYNGKVRKRTSHIISKEKLLGKTHNDVANRIHNRNAVASTSWQKWPLPIPYSFNGISANAQLLVTQAIADLEANTCLKFSQRTSQVDYISFEIGFGCSSVVGRIGGRQAVSLDSNCENIATVKHEIGHAIGLYHTHSRLDRNKYISINADNIDSSNVKNFQPELTAVTYNLEYDYNSVFHYGTHDYSSDGTAVITPIANGASIGSATDYSYLDYVAINLYYECYDKTPLYWPMDEIVDSELLGTFNAKKVLSSLPASKSSNSIIIGLEPGATSSSLNSLRLNMPKDDYYIDLGSYPDKCVQDPAKCTSGFSMAMWLKNNIGGDETSCIFTTLSHSPGLTRGYSIDTVGGGYMSFRYVNSSIDTSIYFPFPAKTWTHLSVTISSTGSLKLYLNGTDVTSDPLVFLSEQPGGPYENKLVNIILGAQYTDGNGFTNEILDVSIDDLALYETELTADQVTNIKSNGPYYQQSAASGSLGLKEALTTLAADNNDFIAW